MHVFYLLREDVQHHLRYFRKDTSDNMYTSIAQVLGDFVSMIYDITIERTGLLHAG